MPSSIPEPITRSTSGKAKAIVSMTMTVSPGAAALRRRAARIREIVRDGLCVVKVKLREFTDEDAAYEYECYEIDRIGLANLTNCVRGGVGRFSGEECPSDHEVVRLFFKLCKYTRDFSRPLQLMVHGQSVEIPQALMQRVLAWMRSIRLRRGRDWVLQIAALSTH